MDIQNLHHFIGIDISKDSLHFAVKYQGKIIRQEEVNNHPKAIKKLLRSYSNSLEDFSIPTSVFCMEHTGIYNQHLLDVLEDSQAQVVIEHATRIKYSSGIQRAKTDTIDAQIIANYVERFADQLELWKPIRPIIKQLHELNSLRERFVKTKKQLTQPMKEIKRFLDKETAQPIIRHTKDAIQNLEKNIKEVDKKIQKLIKNDDQLKNLFQKATSVPGVGKVTATEIIIRTNEFKNVKSAKSLASYAGVAPFEHRSGSSIKKKPTVSKKANLRLKSLLYMGVMSAIQREGELQTFYHKKLAQGKHSMVVINAVKNKILQRLFAVIKNDTIYQKNYNQNLTMS